MFLFSLAMRNLVRNLRRTVITALAVIFGVAIMIFGWGLVDGLDENFIRAAAWTTTGDVLLRPEGYPTDGLSWPLESTKPMPDVAGKVQGKVTGRTFFQARLTNGPESSRVTGIAYDAETDPLVFPRENWKLQGRWPTKGATEIVVGTALARLLRIELDKPVVVEARTLPGALNALTYTVVGIVQTDNNQLDNLGLWIEAGAADELLLLDGRVSHVAVKLDRGEPEEVVGALATPGWTASTVREEVKDLLAVNTIRRVAIGILVVVIMLIAGLGIANTVIMAAYERVREIGTLLALGMRRQDVGRLFLVEGLVLGVVAGLVGATLGVAIVLSLQEKGIILPNEVLAASRDVAMSAAIYTKFRWPPVLGALLFAGVVAEIASIIPARFASNLNPADAVRAD